jgi:AcrR family transcriptional regulator
MTESNGARASLSKDAVIVGAVALADRIGSQSRTIRKLATELGVKPMAIYHHVAGKDEIIDGMIDLVFAQMEIPPDGPGWRDALRVRALSARRVLVGHPWAVPLLETRTVPGPASLRHHDAVLRCLRRAGFSPELVGHAYAVLDAFIFGFALEEAGLPFDAGDNPAEMAGSVLDALPPDAYPDLVAFTRERVLQPDYSYAAEFEYGLDLILDGLEVAAARERAGTD